MTEQQPRARRLGLLGAMVTRVLLLFSLAWIASERSLPTLMTLISKAAVNSMS